MRHALPLAVLLVLPVVAAAQPYADQTSCAQFTAMAVSEQLGLLSTLEPFGDEIDAEDEAASKSWAADVTAACQGHPDRMLPEAARLASGGD